MAPHSSTVVWKIPWTEEPGRLQSMGSLRVRHDWATSLSLSSYIGEGNGNPLQCSCLENPRDEEAWWAAVYGVAQSRTRLKPLSSSSSGELWNQFNGSWQAILKNEIENMSECMAHNKSKYCSVKPSVSVVCVYWVAMSNVFLIMNPQAKKPLKNYCSRPCMLLGYFKIYFSNPFFE